MNEAAVWDRQGAPAGAGRWTGRRGARRRAAAMERNGRRTRHDVGASATETNVFLSIEGT